ncbi:MAG TPA: hypothetical protein H9891_10635 [Candidatus Salinicoccus stercoripullorum]|uniref:Uncharacterized protein n=1 Tax=Candidatus Salinicoccus stercoripullorum TaxID=2838756 RepID=A0A9D1U1S6_9STAP|nr:hypothetical protein [Candidatus Salinicoccus stercoripullorum]
MEILITVRRMSLENSDFITILLTALVLILFIVSLRVAESIMKTSARKDEMIRKVWKYDSQGKERNETIERLIPDSSFREREAEYLYGRAMK